MTAVYVASWILVGIICAAFLHYHSNKPLEKITLQDILVTTALGSIFGWILPVVILLEVIFTLFEDILDVPIWRRKR